MLGRRTRSVETQLNRTGAAGFGRRMCVQKVPQRAMAQAQRVPHYCRFSDAGRWDEVDGNAIKLNRSGGVLTLYVYIRVPRNGEGLSAGDPARLSIFGWWAARWDR
jgi:hypothetical protein